MVYPAAVFSGGLLRARPMRRKAGRAAFRADLPLQGIKAEVWGFGKAFPLPRGFDRLAG
ncbi:hypothetical protein [Cypionkella sp.]|uniref:hypothetical protein n=1 Tax=Cypionkella sp. TaxID=2811411 RepID=UPI002FDEEAAA